MFDTQWGYNKSEFYFLAAVRRTPSRPRIYLNLLFSNNLSLLYLNFVFVIMSISEVSYLRSFDGMCDGLVFKVLQYSIAAPLVSSFGCRRCAAVSTADCPLSSKGAFFQP